MGKLTTIFSGLALLFMLNACTDHSRTFKITVDACDDAWVELDIDALVEKAENQEESTATTDAKGELEVPLVAAP